MRIENFFLEIKNRIYEKKSDDIDLSGKIKKTYWLENRELHNYSTTCMWELKTDWGHYIKEKYHLSEKTCLSIGCGRGELERGLIDIGCVKTVDAFDIDTTSINEAKKIADDKRYSINYFIADANNIILERNRYDLVIAHNSIHHIKKLEHFIQEISDSLKENGLFIMVEYIGPNRFYWTDRQMKIINDVLEILPDRLKKTDLVGVQLKKSVNHDTMQIYLENDPSEAIRSEEIIPVTSQYFEILENLDMGGTILHMLFAEIVNNFNDSNDEDQKYVKLLSYFEKMMIEEGKLPSDFKLIISKKKDQI